MNSHNITNESLALALMLVVVAILISHKEKLALEKDILWSVGRAIIQLIIVGYVLKYIFSVDDASLTLLMVLFIYTKSHCRTVESTSCSVTSDTKTNDSR